MPSYPSRSPSPPATTTNAASPAAAAPASSAAANAASPYVSTSPSGTLGFQPSNGFSPAADSASSARALLTYERRPPGYCSSHRASVASSSRLRSSASPGAGQPSKRCSCPSASSSATSGAYASSSSSSAAFSPSTALRSASDVAASHDVSAPPRGALVARFVHRFGGDGGEPANAATGAATSTSATK